MSELPILITERLILDQPTGADAPRLTELCSDWKIAETTLAIPYPYTEQHARDWIAFVSERAESGDPHSFVIRLVESGELIGVIGLRPDTLHRRAEIGYWVGVPYWGQGYCTEAGLEIIRYGFEHLGLNAITSGYFAGNDPSRRVMAKLGFTQEGMRRQHYYRHGRYIDIAVGTLLRSEWEHR